MKLTAAALAVLLLASPGHSQTAGNCFRLTTAEEQAQGLRTVTPVESCKTSDDAFCLRKAGRDLLRPDLSERYVPVNSCTKDDPFVEEEKP